MQNYKIVILQFESCFWFRLCISIYTLHTGLLLSVWLKYVDDDTIFIFLLDLEGHNDDPGSLLI